MCVHQALSYILLYLCELYGPQGSTSLSAFMCDCWFLLYALHRPALFPRLTGSAQRVSWVLGPSFLSLLTLYRHILLLKMRFPLCSLLHSPPPSLSLISVDLEQSCLSKDECGYEIVIRCRIFFSFVSCIQ